MLDSSVVNSFIVIRQLTHMVLKKSVLVRYVRNFQYNLERALPHIANTSQQFGK